MMYILANFLIIDPQFKKLLWSSNTFDDENQPYLALFESILVNNLPSQNKFVEEWMEKHKRSFESYNEMMKFIIEKIFIEDSSFVEVLSNKMEMILRVEVESISDCKSNELEPLNSDQMSDDTSIADIAMESNPQLSLKTASNNIILASEKNNENHYSTNVVSLHEMVLGYENSKLQIQECRIESTNSEKSEFPLQFQISQAGADDEETVKRRIRAFALRCKSEDGVNTLDIFAMKALPKYKSEAEKDSMIQKLSSYAVFVLYEEY
ncbi:hypothetical protein ENBRE01_3214 [Enteropsectra breve]|nr:hypothetical protein ENBRE01_3214 [Enteropsectra breve]